MLRVMITAAFRPITGSGELPARRKAASSIQKSSVVRVRPGINEAPGRRQVSFIGVPLVVGGKQHGMPAVDLLWVVVPVRASAVNCGARPRRQ